jgi:hypothetical protein
MGIIGLAPYKTFWKSNLAALVCLSSKSRTPEIFVQRLIRSLYKRLGDVSFPVNLNSIAHVLDVKTINCRNLPYSNEECILSPFIGGYRILINTKNRPNETRRRFSCCHEFGHILLERYFSKIDLLKYNLYFESSDDLREEELLCNEIAAEILMPYERFYSSAVQKMPSLSEIDALCEYYGASRSSVIRRLLSKNVWRFDFVCWNISEHDIYPVETWNPCGNVSKDFLSKIVNNSDALSQTASTEKPKREDWTNCIVEHYCTKVGNAGKTVTSLFFNKD